jgi:hypothetical protein
MYLFKERRDTLQGGMVGSMQVSLIPLHPLFEKDGADETGLWIDSIFIWIRKYGRGLEICYGVS